MTSSTLTSEFVTDTMALVLYLEKRRLSSTVKSIFTSADRGAVAIHIPVFVFAEILYLSEKQRITLTLETVSQYIEQYPTYKLCPMTLQIIQSADQIADIPELHDRLIAATARYSGFELITNDPVIRASAFVRTIW
jgi:PIN domain nuclease of toxin-antitoxin system